MTAITEEATEEHRVSQKTQPAATRVPAPRDGGTTETPVTPVSGIVDVTDGHGYLRTAVRALLDTGAADVGGWMAAEGVTPFQRAVAWAMTSPFGMGAAANHTGGRGVPTQPRDAAEDKQCDGIDVDLVKARDQAVRKLVKKD